MENLEREIERAWELRGDDQELIRFQGAIEAVISKLESGELGICDEKSPEVKVNVWVKKGILLYFRVKKMQEMTSGIFSYYDKVELQTNFSQLGVRAVPGAIVRRGAYVESGAILMPSFVNIGARVGSGTMVDTWATVGSCAQIGSNVHLAGGVGIGGVLEPPQARPVIVCDNAFIGSRCVVADGAFVGKNSVLGAGTILTSSVPVISADTGAEISRGVVPDNVVAIGANREREFKGGKFFLPCVLVIKEIDPELGHDKISIENDLRSFGASLA